MVIDTSAFVAIFANEPERPRYVEGDRGARRRGRVPRRRAAGAIYWRQARSQPVVGSPDVAERHATMSRAFEDITRLLPDLTSGEKAQLLQAEDA